MSPRPAPNTRKSQNPEPMRPFPSRFIPPLGPPKTSARERVLAQWRRTNLAPLEKAARLRSRPLGDLMPGVLKDLRIDRRLSEAEILNVWKQTLHPNVVAHAHPTGLRNGVVFVAVDSNAWLSEIVRYHRREILERLQHSFGRDVVKKISFSVG